MVHGVRLTLIVLLVLLVIGIGWFGVRFLGWFESGIPVGQVVTLSTDSQPVVATPNPVMMQPVLESVASGLDTPWSIVFTSPTRMLVTERPGRIRVIEEGVLRPEPLYTFADVSEKGEEGLLSMTVDPNYPENGFIYVVMAYPQDGGIVDKVVRLRDTGATLVDLTVILDRIPAARFHAGARILFGPDGFLYLSTGDATDKNLAQDMNSLAGKILRFNRDGSVPGDNPFPGSLIWSLGHRNPQGLAWHPDTGLLYETEHGPSGFDGPGGGDEINLIKKGQNYGWPLVSHEATREGMIDPLLVMTPAEAPASLLVYSGRVFPEWRGNLFFGALKGEGLMRVELVTNSPDRIEEYEKLALVTFGRIREVMEGPDGYIYFTTSNRDGRGTPSASDDHIMRLRPQEESGFSRDVVE